MSTQIIPAIQSKNIPGFQRIEWMKRELPQDTTEFVTIMWFESLESIRKFAGPDYAQAVVPDAARKLLDRFDSESQHYEVGS